MSRFPPDAVVLGALVAWDLPDPTVEPLAEGYTAHLWRVDTPGVRYVARLAYAAPEVVLSGLEAARRLSEADIRAAAPTPTASGAPYVLVGWPPGDEHPLSLLRFVPGVPLEAAGVDAPVVLGESLGRAHSALVEGSTDRLEHLEFLEDDSDVIRAGAVRPLVHAAVDKIKRVLDRGLTGGTTLGEPEVLVDDDGTPGFIDFGMVAEGPFLFDVSRICIGVRYGIEHPSEEADRFLAAYRRTAPIDEGELVYLEAFMALQWAIQAKFMAGRLARGSSLGSSAESDREGLEIALRKLEARYG